MRSLSQPVQMMAPQAAVRNNANVLSVLIRVDMGKGIEVSPTLVSFSATAMPWTAQRKTPLAATTFPSSHVMVFLSRIPLHHTGAGVFPERWRSRLLAARQNGGAYLLPFSESVGRPPEAAA